jgi:formate dehydrogenase iron-sulfur subunit
VAEAVGFFTDTTVCIGCKACQVACKEWNELPAELGGERPDKTRMPLPLTGDSYDNSRGLSDVNWRHVKFIEQFSPDANRTEAAWLMMSDVCKHCFDAPCLEVCPTGAILRTEFETVYINEPACNGCRDCVAACPFGVIHMSHAKGVAQKCTFCYDRLQRGMTPACAQACPTQSIKFGPLNQLKKDAEVRLAQLRQQGQLKAHLYGADESILGGLNSFYLLVDKPEVYGLPSDPKLPSRSVPRSAFWAIFTAFLTALGVLFTFRGRTVAVTAAPAPLGEAPPTVVEGGPQRAESAPANEGKKVPAAPTAKRKEAKP